MSDFDLCKETLGGKRIIFLGSSVTYGACAMGQSFIEALEKKDGIIAIKEAERFLLMRMLLMANRTLPD